MTDASPPRGGWARAAVIAILVLVGATNLYRAATQSITHDEAFTFNRYASGSWGDVYRDYLPNNHLLHTVLVKASVDLFGPSALAVRLPSVLCGWVFLLCVYRLARDAWAAAGDGLGQRAALVLGVAFVALNPFTLDYLSAARGYGPGTAALLVAVLAMLRALRPDSSSARPAVAAGLACAVAMGFNVAFAFPVAALGAVFAAAMLAGDRSGPLRRRVGRLLVTFVLPAALPAVALLLPLWEPILAAAGRQVGGVESLGATCRGVVETALYHDGPAGRAGAAALLATLAPIASIWVAVATVAIAIDLVSLLRKGNCHGRAGLALLLAGGGFLLTLALHVLGHHALGLAYPKNRVALYLVVLFSVSVVTTTLRMAGGGGWRRVLGAANAVVLGVFVLRFAVQLPTDRYRVWYYDAGSRELFEFLESRRRDDGRPLRVIAVPFQHAESLNFYRAVEGATWMEEVDLAVQGYQDATKEYDYAVLAPALMRLPETAEMIREIAFEDPATGTTIVVPSSDRLRRLVERQRNRSTPADGDF